jgi:hypothetical protein
MVDRVWSANFHGSLPCDANGEVPSYFQERKQASCLLSFNGYSKISLALICILASNEVYARQIQPPWQQSTRSGKNYGLCSCPIAA